MTRWFTVCLGAWLASAPAQADEPKKKGFLGNIRYALGVSLHGGLGTTGRAPVGETPVFELSALEFRSYFSPFVSSHTTINVYRIVDAAVTKGHSRLDYDLHLGFSIPRGDGIEAVIAPGASIGYTFDKSPDSRFVGDLRLGIDAGPPGGRFSWGVYARPFVGWQVVTDATAPDGRSGGLHAGVLLEVALLHHFKPRP